MEAVKHSKIIIILLILYTGIAIAVVTMDRSRKSEQDNKDKKNTEIKISDEEFNEFSEEISWVKGEVENYISNNNITQDTCISIPTIIPEKEDLTDAEKSEPKTIVYTGSVYVSQDLSSIKLWYKSPTLNFAVNNIEIVETELEKSDIEEDYSTDYYDSCGFSK